MKGSHNLIRYILSLSFGLALFSGCSLWPGASQSTDTQAAITAPEDTRVISEGNVAPREFRHLSFAVPGRVAEIMVKEGEQVQQGQILARLGETEQREASLAAAEFERQAAQQDLDELNETAELAAANAWSVLLEAKAERIVAERAWDEIDTDDYQDDIDDATDDVLELEDDLDEAQQDFDRYEDLDEDNATRKKYEEDLDEIRDDYDEALRDRDELIIRRDLAEAAVEQSRAAETKALQDYTATRNGPDPDQLALAQARLDSAKAQITAIQASLDDLELIAPFEGTVVEINIIENELISPGNWAILIADYSRLYVETNDLTELEVVKIAVGQTASLAPDALPDLVQSGTVEEISDSYKFQSGDILYDVRILIDKADPRLRWGMTVEVTFENNQ